MLQSNTVKGLTLALLLGVSAQSHAFSLSDVRSYLPNFNFRNSAVATVATVATAVVGGLAWYFWPRKVQNVRFGGTVCALPEALNVSCYFPHNGTVNVFAHYNSSFAVRSNDANGNEIFESLREINRVGNDGIFGRLFFAKLVDGDCQISTEPFNGYITLDDGPLKDALMAHWND